MRSAKLIFLTVGICLLLAYCKTVPKKLLFQAQTATRYSYKNDTIYLSLDNPLKCPMRYYLSSSDSIFNLKLKKYRVIVLPPQTDTNITIAADSLQVKTLLINTGLGNPAEIPVRNTLALPYPKGKTYKVIQAYDGEYSHHEPYSKYAIDFSLGIGDTVCAADNGVVVGVISGYKYGGANKKWKQYANYITLYHPHTGLYTQYVHVKCNGALVKIGDSVQRGQAIGLSGKTGWTDVAHLHFNTLVAVKEGLMSVPMEFNDGVTGASLQPGDRVTNTSGL